MKNSVCLVNGIILQIRSMSGMKPMSSMRSASSMTSKLDAGEQQSAALGMIEQPARGGDQHVDAARQLGVLVAERDAADQERDVEFLAGAVFIELSP